MFSVSKCSACISLPGPPSALLDDLDKELNNYIMRCREWYGWHFPELGKVVTDNLAYCKTIRKIGKSLHLESFHAVSRSGWLMVLVWLSIHVHIRLTYF